MYGLLCNLDLIIVPWQYLIDVFTIKQPLHTIIFLLLSTLTIMHYETMIPLFLLGIAVYILMVLYDHKIYQPIVPDVKANIDFIKHMSESIGQYRFEIESYVSDVVYWNEPTRSTRLVTKLILASAVSFIILRVVRIRLILCILIWGFAAS